jgi:hypothetical protein
MENSSMPRPGLAAMVVAAVCALAVLGCGGGSSGDDQTAGNGGGSGEAGKEAPSSETESTPTEESKSPAESKFVTQANAVCFEVEEGIRNELGTYLKSKGVKEIGEGESAAGAKAQQIAVVKKFALPALRKQQAGIEALDPPGEVRAQVKEYLAALEKGIEEGERQPALVYSSSVKAIEKSDAIAGELGLESCGNR